MALVDGAAYERAMTLVGQLRRQAEIDTAALNRYKADNDVLRQQLEAVATRHGVERALADKLMDVLSRMVVGWERIIGADLAQHPDVLAVSAEYREARQR